MGNKFLISLCLRTRLLIYLLYLNPWAFPLLLLPFSAQSCCWGCQGEAGWFFYAAWGETTTRMHHKLWQGESSVPKNTLILGWGQMCWGSPVPGTPSFWAGGCCRSGRCAVLPSLVHTAGFGPWAGDVPMGAGQVWAPLLQMREEPCSLCLLYWL